MTTLRDTEQDAPPQFPEPPPPSPWSAPRPDGPLAAALRLAQTQRAAGALPAEAPSPSAPEAFEKDIEALAREARDRDVERESLAIALEWPEETSAEHAARGARWKGWVALGAALILAALAAAVAVSFAPPEESATVPVSLPGNDGLRLERQLPPSPGPGQAPR